MTDREKEPIVRNERITEATELVINLVEHYYKDSVSRLGDLEIYAENEIMRRAGVDIDPYKEVAQYKINKGYYLNLDEGEDVLLAKFYNLIKKDVKSYPEIVEAFIRAFREGYYGYPIEKTEEAIKTILKIEQ